MNKLLNERHFIKLLEADYFNYLEENQADFLDIDDAGTSTVKPEFIVPTNEMAQVIGYRDLTDYIYQQGF